MRKVVTMGVAFALLGGSAPPSAHADPADRCATYGNDDTIRRYERSLRPEFVRAYRRLFPNVEGTPTDSMLRAQAAFRCMNGRLFACFAGANLPCAKIATDRDNRGADAFCRDDPNANVVPMVATGHDAAFSYRCRDGHAEVTGPTFELDARGFAKSLWTPLD